MAKPPNSTLRPTKSRVLGESLLKTELAETQTPSSLARSDELKIMMPQLYDVESSYSEPEESLPLDLDLDQIEDCQE